MNKREWSMFDRCYSGLLKYSKLKDKCIFITLTSTDVSVDGLEDRDVLKFLKVNFDTLRKRYKDEFKVDFGEYFRVSTLEGNGVLHIVVNNSWIDHDWLVSNWNEVHGSNIVDVRSLDGDVWRAARYVISQYVAGQDGLKIFGYSRNWVYSGFTRDLKEAMLASRDFTRECSYMGFVYFPVRYDYFRVLWSIYLDFRLIGENPEFWRISPMVNAVLDGNDVLMTSAGGSLHER